MLQRMFRRRCAKLLVKSQLALRVCICVLALTVSQLTAKSDDALVSDEAAIAAHIKALHDPNNEVRATAAAALREIVAKYPNGTSNIRDQDCGEAAWAKKVDQVRPGMTETEARKLLPIFADSPEYGSEGSGDSHVDVYRIDWHWVVTIQYRNPDTVIEKPKLSRREAQIHAEPPKNFTGTWTCWHVNGQKGQEAQYKNGKYNGTLTSYHDNGAKNYEQHYTNHGGNGKDTGWYRDGKLMYEGQYRNGEIDGNWISWYPSGLKQSESNYINGVENGCQVDWYENGQMRYEKHFKDGIKHGIDAAWTEQGAVIYERRYLNGKLFD